MLSAFGANGLLRGTTSIKQALGAYLLITLGVVVISIPMGISWWKQIDEAARDAHKTAWFWGGSIGMTVAILIAALNLFFDGALLTRLGEIYHISDIQKFGFEIGLLNVIVFMGLGYMIHWGLWWQQRR
ncbi:MAG: hypothetical protein FD163_1569 [Hyphomonadaceae bacterium]|nr:MAG: hypothetical protein FD128_564 [Hyphomonadaceae bacterium]KAF0184872.1 MAG: hypothetical protein FD163_1569 [Hyphomonadaceae bacterium]